MKRGARPPLNWNRVAAQIGSVEDGYRALGMMLWWPTNGQPPAWTADAACRDADPDLWHSSAPGRWGDRRGHAICQGCPVMAECREDNARWETETPGVSWGHRPPPGVVGGQAGTERAA